MTDGQPKETKAWVEKLGATYAYGFDKSMFCLRGNIRVYPHAILVDPRGVVIWQGHPEKLDAKRISAALKGALRHPIYSWPEDCEAVRSAWRAGQYSKALDLAHKLEDCEGKQPAEGSATLSIVAAVEQLIDLKVAGLEAIFERGDLVQCWATAHALSTALEGHEDQARVAALIAKINEDEDLIARWQRQQAIMDVVYRGYASVDKANAGVVISELSDLIEAERTETIGKQDATMARAYLKMLVEAGSLK